MPPIHPFYEPRSLLENPDPGLVPLVQAAKQRRLVLYAGAGVSVAAPSCGPKGSTVADRLRPIVAAMLAVGEQDLADLTLEELAQRVAESEPDRMEELRVRALATFDFRDADPNFAHHAAALLMREGLVQLVSVNWDCGVERAGLQAEVSITGVADELQALQLAGSLPVYKVHGCATRPGTIALTQEEVDHPQAWAIARVQGALGNGYVVFVGLGTVGLYVSEPVEELVSRWGANSTIRVVDPELSNSWGDALGPRRNEAHIATSAEAFLDDFLRAVVRDALDDTAQDVQVLANHDAWAHRMRAGFELLRGALDSRRADAILRWWRDGMADTQAGQPFVTEPRGRKAMMTVALLIGLEAGVVKATGVRGRLTVSRGSHYFEIISKPGQHISDVEPGARYRIMRRLEEGVYADPEEISIVVVDATGTFPSPTAPPDIAAAELSATDVGEGPTATGIRLVSAEDGVSGKLVA